MFTYQNIFKDKQKVLFVTAHPDDLDVFFAGLIYQLCQDTKDIFVLVITNGARGSRENEIAEEKLAEQRIQEQIDALNILGVQKEHFFCLHYKDGEVESDLKLIGEISKYIRKLQVDMVCTMEPSHIYQQTYSKKGYFVQHRDHRKVGEATIDAVYPFSRDRSFFPEHYSEKGIKPRCVYDILLTDEKGCNFDFDYSEHVEIKREALRAHKSQFNEETVMDIIDSSKFDGKYLEKFNYLKLMW